MNIEDKSMKLNKYIAEILPKIEKEPQGFLEYPYGYFIGRTG